MASISTDKKGRQRLHFTGADRKRRTIYLTGFPERVVQEVKHHVEHLVYAQAKGYPVDAATARWCDELLEALAEKLTGVGLAVGSKRPSEATLGPFLDDYVKLRIDVKPATKEVWSQVVRNLKDHFGHDRPLSSITEGDAENFKMFLVGEKLAPTTIHKRLQFARMFFRAAKKRKRIQDNPFAEVTAKAVMRDDRQRFISPEEVDRLLAVCNPTWKTIVGLARYGGLRCPSEVLSLRWEDVNWDTGRIVVQSPKTEHHPGKASRTIPLFAELRPILDEAWELAPKGAVYVVAGDHREKANTPGGWRNCNLRTHFERLVRRAGLTPWPRLFHALRASRETELVKEHPIHVVTTWLGNTPRVAMKHYLQVTDADFEKATGGNAKSNARPRQKAPSQSNAEKSPPSQESCPATTCDVLRSPAIIISGEDRIRTCGPREGPRV